MPVRIDIKAHNTHKKIGLKRWNQGFRNFLKGRATEIFKYFSVVAAGFVNHQVDVTQKRGVRKSEGNLEVVVGALEPTEANRVFSWVNWGTGARIIYVRQAPFLVFRPGYKRATKPGSLQVSPPWEKTGSRIFLRAVSHPGIEARRFDQLIQVLVQADMHHEGERAVSALAKQTWRG
jgi:hypothetical protein